MACPRRLVEADLAFHECSLDGYRDVRAVSFRLSGLPFEVLTGAVLNPWPSASSKLRRLGAPQQEWRKDMDNLDAPLMDTVGGQIGSFVGHFFVALVVPIVLLIILKLIPPMRRRPAVTNGIAGALAVLIAFVPVNTPLVQKIIVAVLLATLFFWQFVRDKRALARAPAASVSPQT
jgi:hypothetical protein